MLRLLGVVISIGLADSLNPSTLGPALYMASRDHPRRRVLEFTAGTFAVSFLGGLILTLGPGRALLSLVPHPSATTGYVLETLAGAALIVVAAVLWRRRMQLERPKTDQRSNRQSSFLKAARTPVLVGATISAIELPTAFPYFAAIAAIVASDVGVANQVILVAVYNVCFVLPLLGIALMLTVFGDRAVGILSNARKSLRRRWPTVAAAVALVAGLFVIALGITGLASSAPGTVGRVSRRLHRLIPH